MKSLSAKSMSLVMALLSLLACRPIIAIGWPELTLLVVLIVILLGPLLFKLYRFLDKIQKASQSEEKKKRT
jgi:hypothetical protein